MYEVHPDDSGKWILYKTGDGGFELVAWFAEKEDAQFAKRSFEQRDRREAAPVTRHEAVTVSA